MAIYSTDLITIDGSSRFLGGEVYNANFNQGFNGEHSTLDVDIIAENQQYQNPIISFTSPYNIKLGNDIEMNFYIYRYCIEDGDGGKILRVGFRDGIDKLSRKFIGLRSIFLNIKCDSLIVLGKSASDLSAQGLPANQFDHYTYDEFQAATAFLGIPKIPTNPYVTLNEQANVLEVFNRFMAIYGYSWYMDLDGVIRLIDIKRAINLDPTIINNLETHSKRLNSTNCFDAGNNQALGAVAMQPAGDNTTLILSTAYPLWDGDFLKVPFKWDKDHFDACIMATLSPELFFAYMVMRIGWPSALTCMGFKWKEVIPLSQKRNILAKLKRNGDPIYLNFAKNNVGSLVSPGATFEALSAAQQKALAEDDLAVVVYEEVKDDTVRPFDIARKLGELFREQTYYIMSSFVNLSITWQEGGVSELSPNAKIAEAIDFSHVLDFTKIGRLQPPTVPSFSFVAPPNGLGQEQQPTSLDPRNATIKEITNSDAWIMKLSNGDFLNNKMPKALNSQKRPFAFNGVGAAASPFFIDIPIGLKPDFVTIEENTPGTTVIRTDSGLSRSTIPKFTLSDALKASIQENQIEAEKLFPQTPAQGKKDGDSISAADVDKKYSDPKYKVAIINKWWVDKFTLFIPDFSYTRKHIKGTGTPKNSSNDNYSLGNRAVVKSICPNVDDITSSIDFKFFENPVNQEFDAEAYLQQVANNVSQLDQNYSCEIRGITLGFNLGPADGLRSIRISYGSNGYRSNYELSNSRPAFLETDSFRQKFPIN